MRKYLIFAFGSLIFGLSSCDKDNDKLCYSFDIRQCQTDLFAQDVPESDSREMRESKMVQWFEGKGIDIVDISLALDFHEAVCEACDACPQGDRYYIKLEKTSTIPDATVLRLLSFEETDCGDYF